MRKLTTPALWVLVLVLPLGCTSHSKKAPEKPLYTAGAVASPDAYGALAAKEILNAGGNAVDAAVATAFTLAVTYPEAGNLGGGGFMTLWIKGQPYFLDYREMAPGNATANMFLDENGNILRNQSTYSAKAVAVPGSVAGLWDAHKRFGKLPWARDLAPAIEYATKGFIISENFLSHYHSVLPQMPKKNNHLRQTFRSAQLGKLFLQPDLAKVLTEISNLGPKGFYEGWVAQLIVSEMEKDGGILSLDDLSQYRTYWRDAVSREWKGMTVISAPPPSSGGIALLQLLTMRELLSKDFQGMSVGSAKYVHLMAEMEKRVFSDRSEYLGDPGFVDVPVADLISDIYLQNRALEIDPKLITKMSSVIPGLDKERTQTTHFSIVDAYGNAVSNTTTLNGWFGSGIVVSGGGFLLNNEMDDFVIKEGAPSHFGMVGNGINAVTPYKRPLSSMSPTILTKDGKLEMILGTPGGPQILTILFQVLSHVYDEGMTLDAAIAAPRYHHQLYPENMIFVEKSLASHATENALRKMGYHISDHQWVSGDVQAIEILKNKPYPLSDPRSNRGQAGERALVVPFLAQNHKKPASSK